ncbi:hypothetical protein QBC39DRAFT_16989 [Podospora conica]|nr:hypothetical protein QBC39DRAFT_16989 [Schizothecium conicum]
MYTTADSSWCPDPTKPIVCILIDNSNLFIGGKQAYAARHRPRLAKHSGWRVDYKALLTELLRCIPGAADLPAGNISIDLYGSCLPFTEIPIANNLTIKIHEFNRSPVTGKEKSVDTAIIGDLSLAVGYDLGRGVKDGVHYVVVSGDWDVAGSAIDRLKGCGFRLHIWAWDDAMASGLRTLEPGNNLRVYSLDDILDEITLHKPGNFDADAISERAPLLHSQTLVVTNPSPDLWDELKTYSTCSLSAVQWQQKDIDGNLLIVPVWDDTKDDNEKQQVLIGFIHTVMEDPAFQRVGCQVLTLEEYRAECRLAGDDGGNKHRRNNSGFNRTNNDSTLNNKDTTGAFPQIPELRPKDRCRYGGYCKKGLQCTYKHTEEEKKRFAGGGEVRWKTALCRDGQDCQREDCWFAHGLAELFCPKCGTHGHEKGKCPSTFKLKHLVSAPVFSQFSK